MKAITGFLLTVALAAGVGFEASAQCPYGKSKKHSSISKSKSKSYTGRVKKAGSSRTALASRGSKSHHTLTCICRNEGVSNIGAMNTGTYGGRMRSGTGVATDSIYYNEGVNSGSMRDTGSFNNGALNGSGQFNEGDINNGSLNGNGSFNNGSMNNGSGTYNGSMDTGGQLQNGSGNYGEGRGSFNNGSQLNSTWSNDHSGTMDNMNGTGTNGGNSGTGINGSGTNGINGSGTNGTGTNGTGNQFRNGTMESDSHLNNRQPGTNLNNGAGTNTGSNTVR